MNRYILHTSHGRRVFIQAQYSFEAEKKAKPFLGRNERVSSWAVADGRETPPDPRRDLVIN